MFKGFDKLKKRHQLLYILIVGVAVILVWRGVWNILDDYFLPEYWLLSNILSIVIGIIVIAFAHERLS